MRKGFNMNLKNQPHPSAIDKIARWYGRTKAVERIAKDYRKRPVTSDYSEDFRTLHKDAKALSESVWRLGIIQDYMARETISHIDLPMKELHREVIRLETRLSVLLTSVVMQPVHRRRYLMEGAKYEEETEVAMHVDFTLPDTSDTCAHCKRDLATEDMPFYWIVRNLWYCSECAHHEDAVPANVTDEYRLNWYAEHKAKR